MDFSTIHGGGRARRLQLEAVLKLDRVNSPLSRQADEEPDECLVEDHRGSLRPAQQVERKLVTMLQTSAVCVSHLQKDARPRHG